MGFQLVVIGKISMICIVTMTKGSFIRLKQFTTVFLNTCNIIHLTDGRIVHVYAIYILIERAYFIRLSSQMKNFLSFVITRVTCNIQLVIEQKRDRFFFY